MSFAEAIEPGLTQRFDAASRLVERRVTDVEAQAVLRDAVIEVARKLDEMASGAGH
jgi:hypothetical protein